MNLEKPACGQEKIQQEQELSSTPGGTIFSGLLVFPQPDWMSMIYLVLAKTGKIFCWFFCFYLFALYKINPTLSPCLFWSALLNGGWGVDTGP